MFLVRVPGAPGKSSSSYVRRNGRLLYELTPRRGQATVFLPIRDEEETADLLIRISQDTSTPIHQLEVIRL